MEIWDIKIYQIGVFDKKNPLKWGSGSGGIIFLLIVKGGGVCVVIQ